MRKKRESGDELRQQLNKIMTMPEGADWPLVSRAMDAVGVGVGDYAPFVDCVRKGGWCDAPDPVKAIRKSVYWSNCRFDRGPREEITGCLNSQWAINRLALKRAREPEREESGVIAKCLPAQYVIPRPLSQEEKARLANLIKADAGYPDGWNSEGPIDRRVIPDWDKIAADAGLDRWERCAVVYMAAGISRERAIGDQRSKSTKLSLQNAYKRLQRGKRDKLNQFVRNLIAQEQARGFPADVYTFAPEDVEVRTDPEKPKTYTLREAATSFFRRRESLVQRRVDARMLCPIGASSAANEPLFSKEDLDRFKQEREPFVQTRVGEK
jgi:hypothetical protein